MVDLLESAWALYILFVLETTSYGGAACPVAACPSPPNTWVFPVLALTEVVLLGISVACFIRRWIAYPLGILLSVLTISLVALQWDTFGATSSAVATAIAIVAIVVNVAATLSKTKLPEQNHPLNLPVFG